MVSSSRARMTRNLGKTPAMFVLAAMLGITGCGSRPWVQPASGYQDAALPEGATVVDVDPTTTTIIVVEPSEPGLAAQNVVVQQQAAPVREAWTPPVLPEKNPFERFRTWVGDYDCVQGNTGFAFRIMDVRGRVVRAIFDFSHESSGASGSYVVMGHYDPDTRRVHFEPSRWIDRPDNYVMVPMSGEISTDDSLFAGKIDFPGCGAFKLKPTR